MPLGWVREGGLHLALCRWVGTLEVAGRKAGENRMGGVPAFTSQACPGGQQPSLSGQTVLVQILASGPLHLLTTVTDRRASVSLSVKWGL